MQLAEQEMLGDTEKERATIWHVGRRGEVAGGMTQVVNGYLRWPFAEVDVGSIVSRDGSTGLSAGRLFLSAVWRILTLGSHDRNAVVVHLSQGGSFVREGMLLWLARKRGYGTIAHLHGSRFVEFSTRHQRFVARVLVYATKVFVLSEATRNVVRTMIPEERVELVPNAVPHGVQRAKERLVVFGGAVTFRKGVDVLLQAWRSIDRRKGWRLVLAGPETDKGLLDGDLTNVEVRGAIPHSELMELLERSSVAVLPSRDEAMPMFILEALARNNCVVSTRVGGIPSVLDDDRGVLVAPGDVSQLARALTEVMYDDATRSRIADEGRRSFDLSFSAEAVYPKVEALWKWVLQHPVPVARVGSAGTDKEK